VQNPPTTEVESLLAATESGRHHPVELARSQGICRPIPPLLAAATSGRGRERRELEKGQTGRPTRDGVLGPALPASEPLKILASGSWCRARFARSLPNGMRYSMVSTVAGAEPAAGRTYYARRWCGVTLSFA
jgi:hypothetical protein